MTPDSSPDHDASLQRGRGSVISGLRWNLTGQASTQAIRALVSLILASMLGPRAFGLMAIALALIAFVDMFIDMGSGQAVIQRRELSKALVDSVFAMNLLIGVGLGLLLALGAPAFAWLFGDPELEGIFRIISLAFPTSAASIVHRALLVRRMQFGRLAGIQLASVIVTGVVGILLAYRGYGVWALVYGTLAGLVLTTLALWWATGWVPSLRLSPSALREISSFSRNLTLYNLLAFVMNQADKLVLGRLLGSTALGFYSLGERLVQRPIHAIGVSVEGAIISRFSEWQDRDDALRSGYLRALAGVAFLVFPVVAGLAVVSDWLIALFLSSEWAPAASVLMLLAPAYAARALTRPVVVVLRAKDRTDLVLRWGLFQSSLLLLAYFAALWWDLAGVCVAISGAQIAVTIPYLLLPCSLTGLRARDVARSLGEIAAATAVMVAAVIGFRALVVRPPEFAMLAVQVALGAAIYGLAILVLRRELLGEVLRMAGIRKGPPVPAVGSPPDSR